MRPPTKTDVEMVFRRNLRPHPLSARVYGPFVLADPEFSELLDSIKAHGILEPLLITHDDRVVSGHRRLEAAHCTQVPFVPCIRVKTKDDLEIERLVIESNRYRQKTSEQRAREYKELKRIEAAKAKQRMTAGKGSDGSGGRGNPKNPVKNFSQGLGQGKASALAAKQVGMSAPTAEKAAVVVEAIDEAEAHGDTDTAARLRETLERKSVSAAYRRVVPPLPVPPVPPAPTPDPAPEEDAVLLTKAERAQLDALKAAWDDAGAEVRAAFRTYIE